MRKQLFANEIHQEGQENLLGLLKQKERLSLKYLQSNNIILSLGRSISLDVKPAYNKLMYLAKKHFLQSDQLYCYFYYSVINATTTKLLCNLFKVLERASKEGNKVIIYWISDEGNEELIEVGNDLKEVFDLDFNISIR